MKPFTAILFSLLLLLTPFASLQTLAVTCPPAKAMACCQAGCPMVCCLPQNSNPQSTPVVPAQKDSIQDQVSPLALAVVIYRLPESATFTSISSATESILTGTLAPLYTRDCALLL